MKPNLLAKLFCSVFISGVIASILFATSSLAGPCDWFKLKSGLHLDPSYDSLCERMQEQFPLGDLAGELLRHFGDEMNVSEYETAQGFLEAELDNLKIGPLSVSEVRKKISMAHWLSHIYEYRSEWHLARSVVLETIQDDRCGEILESECNFYEFGILGHFNQKPIEHLKLHLAHIGERWREE